MGVGGETDRNLGIVGLLSLNPLGTLDEFKRMESSSSDCGTGVLVHTLARIPPSEVASLRAPAGLGILLGSL